MNANHQATVKVLPKLDQLAQQQVRSLLNQAKNADATFALDEAARLSLKNAEAGATHFLYYSNSGPAADLAEKEVAPELWGYANLLPDATVQGMVHPARRRQGIGSALLQAVLAKQARPGIWVHGAGSGGVGFLESKGLQEIRQLHQMRLSLKQFKPMPGQLPDEARIRNFDGSQQDLQSLVDVNAQAFATHPEQGSLGLRDFKHRMEEPWFKPSELLFLTLEDNLLAAFLWIKTEGTVAEIYVAATRPKFHGRGYAKTLLQQGLQQLQAAGFETVTLYVDGSNQGAIKLYAGLGFEVFSSDFQFTFPT